MNKFKLLLFFLLIPVFSFSQNDVLPQTDMPVYQGTSVYRPAPPRDLSQVIEFEVKGDSLYFFFDGEVQSVFLGRSDIGAIGEKWVEANDLDVCPDWKLSYTFPRFKKIKMCGFCMGKSHLKVTKDTSLLSVNGRRVDIKVTGDLFPFLDVINFGPKGKA